MQKQTIKDHIDIGSNEPFGRKNFLTNFNIFLFDT